MSIALQCDQCGKRYKVGENLAGRSVKCKGCDSVLKIPGAAGRPATASAPSAPTPPPALDIFGFDDAPTPKASAAGAVDDEAPPLPRAGAPARPKTKEQKKAFEKRVKANDRKRSSFSQSAFGVSFGAAFMVSLFAWNLYRRVVRPLRAIARVAAAGSQDPGRSARAPRKVGPITPPAFPDAGEGTLIAPGVRFHEVRLGPSGPSPESPGHRGRLWLYEPDGKHATRSLPCILIAGAGSNLITGMNLTDADRAEHLPYVHAGFAVLAYELDGDTSDDDDDIVEPCGAFLAAQAGLVNARNALDFLAIKATEVDPERLYAVGHSSAGTLALLLAENEPRIKGCVAFAPATDTGRSFGPSERAALAQEIPGAGDLFTRFNPKMHEDAIHCPVFLFHAQDDSNVPVAETIECKARLERLGKTVTLETVPTGDHYGQMLAQGIPRAVAWLKGQAGIP